MQSSFRFLPALVVAGFPALAFAHPGHHHGPGFAAGLAHPLTGIDHLLAAVLLAAAIAVAARFTLARPGVVAAVAAAMAAVHAGVHALLPPVSAGFAAGVAISTAAIYAAAAVAGLVLASRRLRRATTR
jgi:urease accessory protein